MFSASDADLYTADVYLGELNEGKNLVFSIASYWTLSASPGTISIRVEIYLGTDLADSQTFEKAKVTSQATQFLQP
jgi:hypothetical protein